MKISIKYVIPILGRVLSATDQSAGRDPIASHVVGATAKSGSKVCNGNGLSGHDSPSKYSDSGTLPVSKGAPTVHGKYTHGDLERSGCFPWEVKYKSPE